MSASLSRSHSPSSSLNRNPSLLPSALPRDPSDIQSSEAQTIVPGGLSHEASLESEEQPEPEHSFEPFFVHVEDIHSSSTSHPEVRYIFSDDDGEVLTDRLLRINSNNPYKGGESRQGSTGQSGRSRQARGTKERSLVVNLAPDGRSVESAHSLSGDWQVLGVDVVSAPTLEGEREDGGLMLKVRGTAGIDEDRDPSGKASSSKDTSLEALVASYRERMDELTKILEGDRQ